MEKRDMWWKSFWMKLHSIVNDLRRNFLNTKYWGTCLMFIDSNTAILSSAAIERLFSVGKDVLKPKRTGSTDQNFEILVFLKGACNQSMEF